MPPRHRRRGRYVVVGVLLVAVLGVGAALVIFSSASASLTTDPSALARVGLPLGGGKIASVFAVTGPRSQRVPVSVRGDQIWPRGTIPAGSHVTIDVVVKRPGWIAWLAGSREKLHLSLVTPTARLGQNYVTLGSGAPLRLRFNMPVAAVSYGPSATQLSRHVLTPPSRQVTLARQAEAGSIWVAAVPRSWETAKPAVVSWFPAGAGTAAVANPAPGGQIGPNTPISLTFSKTVSAALGSSMPPVSPITSGTWHQLDSHTIVFRPEGYGYGLGAHVTVGLPAGVKLVGGQANGSSEFGAWTVPPGSTLRLQQLLAPLGYLPLRFSASSSVANTPQAQEAAAIKPPNGSFSWSYPNIPSALHSMWQPGTAGEMTKGAVMAFENDQGMTADGVAGPAVWKALFVAALAGHRSSFGYTFVQVSEGSPRASTSGTRVRPWSRGRSTPGSPRPRPRRVCSPCSRTRRP